MHPLLHLLMTQPGLLGEHAQGYGELLGSELAAFKQAGQRRLVWGAAAACLALAGVVLAGVAVMLWSALSAMPPAAPWVLLATPAVALAAALGCWMRMRAQTPANFAHLREQIKADMHLLQEVSAP
jgi:hypothetical protein